MNFAPHYAVKVSEKTSPEEDLKVIKFGIGVFVLTLLLGCETDNRNNTNDIRPSTATETGSHQGSPPKG